MKFCIMHKLLHFIRCCVSFVPGGQCLAQLAMSFVAKRNNARARLLLQLKGMDVCRKVNETMSSRGVKYFADHGTLLGLVRENGMIKHDTDMDFSIPPDQEFGPVVEALIQNGFSLIHGFAVNGAVQEVTVGYEGLTLDFFKCHLIGNCLGHYVFVTKYDSKNGKHLGTMAHERRRPPLSGLETHLFGPKSDVPVSVPSNAVEYLTASYGNWKVPDLTSDFSSDKIPTQYRDITEGCELLGAAAVQALLATMKKV